MNFANAATILKALGYTVDGGYVFAGKYRFGKIDDDLFTPESDYIAPIPLSEIETFSDCNQGVSGHCLDVIKNDGTSTRLARSHLRFW